MISFLSGDCRCQTNKAQSRQWVGPGSQRPKKFKTQPSAGQVMATVF